MSSTNQPLSLLLQQALVASAANNTAAALDLLTQASRDEPASALPHFLLGAELAQSGRYLEAESAYANAVLLAPEWAIVRYELGSLQFTSGRVALAFMTWEPLLNLAENDALRLFVLGYGELARDAFADALNYFERGIEKNTYNPPLNGNIRLLIEAIRTLMHTPPSLSTPSENGEATENELSETDYFLLSAYRNPPLH